MLTVASYQTPASTSSRILVLPYHQFLTAVPSSCTLNPYIYIHLSPMLSLAQSSQGWVLTVDQSSSAWGNGDREVSPDLFIILVTPCDSSPSILLTTPVADISSLDSELWADFAVFPDMINHWKVAYKIFE